MKIAVVGVGKLGGAIAFALAREGGWDEIVLADAVEGLAWAQAEDIRHGLPGTRVPKIRSASIEGLAGADVVVLAAGEGRRPDMTRLDLLQTNAPLVSELSQDIARVAPDATLIVLTNPMDVMTTIAWRASGRPRDRVIGSGTLLDSIRLRVILADRYEAAPEEIEAFVFGEHGERAVPILSRATIRGRPLTVSASERAAIEGELRGLSGRIIAAKGGTAFGPAGTTVDLIRALVAEPSEIVPASVVLDGEYGARGVAIGVPAVLGRGRVQNVQEWALSDEERAGMEAAVCDLKGFVEDASVVLNLVRRSSPMKATNP